MSHVAVMGQSESDPPIRMSVNGDGVVGHVSPVVVVAVVVLFATTTILAILSMLSNLSAGQLVSLPHCAGGGIWTVWVAGEQVAAAATTTKPPQVQVIEVQWQWRRQV